MKSIKINLAKYEAHHALAASRGAPRHLLRHKFELTARTLSACRHASLKIVTPTEQLAAFARTLKEPAKGAYWLAIGSPDGDTTALMCALAAMVRVFDAHAHSPETVARPFLHPVFGGRYDKLRDDQHYRDLIGRVGLLVINNLAANSTPDKIEKARDLLVQWQHVPRIVVIAGADPLAFCIDTLYMRPTRVLNLGTSSRVTKQL